MPDVRQNCVAFFHHQRHVNPPLKQIAPHPLVRPVDAQRLKRKLKRTHPFVAQIKQIVERQQLYPFRHRLRRKEILPGQLDCRRADRAQPFNPETALFPEFFVILRNRRRMVVNPYQVFFRVQLEHIVHRKRNVADNDFLMFFNLRIRNFLVVVISQKLAVLMRVFDNRRRPFAVVIRHMVNA